MSALQQVVGQHIQTHSKVQMSDLKPFNQPAGSFLPAEDVFTSNEKFGSF